MLTDDASDTKDSQRPVKIAPDKHFINWAKNYWCHNPLIPIPDAYLLPVSDVLEFAEEENATALGLGCRLHDPDDALILLELLHEDVVLTLGT